MLTIQCWHEYNEFISIGEKVFKEKQQLISLDGRKRHAAWRKFYEINKNIIEDEILKINNEIFEEYYNKI